MTGRIAIIVGIVAALMAGDADAESKKQKAANLAREAMKHYQAQQYVKAAELFVQSFDLSGVPSQLRNAAKAFELANELPRALELWSRYRDLKRVSRDERLEAVAHVELILERQRKEAAEKSAEAAAKAAARARRDAEAARDAARAAERPPPAPEAIVQQTAAAEPETDSPTFVPWIILGAGGALGIASAVLWFVTQSSRTDFQARLAQRDQFGLITGTSFDDAESDLSSINRNRAVSGVLLGAAITAVATGSIWAIVDAASSSKSDRELFNEF